MNSRAIIATYTNATEEINMKDLINQLPKQQQKLIVPAIIMAKQGNNAALLAARRCAATKRTETIIQNIIDLI